ncbi:MAG TPA: competence/damage-inducible protein A [Bryobacteraceae bacterium]|nr:competence/damage-inducible protein A [Bryobacteraceae bacterium]
MPDAEIIAVGSELLTPQKLDTNSLFLTDQLNTLGVEVVRKTVVGDDRARLADTLRGSLGRSQIIVLSGGLGPTEDDVTRDATALALGRALHFCPDLFAQIEARFRRLNRRMAEVNRRQAFLVEGAEPLPNDSGTAPGQWVEADGACVMLLPGPPHELKAMFTRECLPRLKRRLPPQVIRALELRVAGMGESDLDQLIAPIYTKYLNPTTTILAAVSDIQIHLRARCETAEEAEALLAEVARPIETLLGDRVYSRDGATLEAVIGRMLKQRGETLSVAESLTGGTLGARITSVPGSSEYFIGGFLVYTDEMKHRFLGVSEKLLQQHTAVSEPVALAMASGVRELARSAWTLALTGYAGPDGGTEANPVGTLYIGIAGPGILEARRMQFNADRARIRALATQSALDLLRKTLLLHERQ